MALIDKRVWKYIDRIQTVDFESPYTQYWSDVYGYPIKILAVGGWIDGLRSIVIYPQNRMIISDVFYHEIGHLIDNDTGASSTRTYQNIYASAKKLSYRNIREDFAESVKYYFMEWGLDLQRKNYLEYEVLKFKSYEEKQLAVSQAKTQIKVLQNNWWQSQYKILSGIDVYAQKQLQATYHKQANEIRQTILTNWGEII
jgi:hypothetical protein